MPIDSLATGSVADALRGLPDVLDRAAADSIMRRLGELTGAPGYMLARYDPNIDDPSRLVIVADYPEEWVVTYARERYDKVDPTLRYITRVDRPYRWSEAMIAMEAEGDRRALEVMERAAELGYPDGWTFPISSRRGLVGGAVLGGLGPYEWPSHLVSALWGAMHTVWWRHLGRQPDALPHATRREREVLTLLAEGLVSRAIGERMGVAATTVDWHIAQLSDKLGARNRQHLVALAMRTGLIA